MMSLHPWADILSLAPDTREERMGGMRIVMRKEGRQEITESQVSGRLSTWKSVWVRDGTKAESKD